MSRKPFHFKQFDIHHDKCSMKVGTDGVLLGAWASVANCKRILDIGTGSGLIAIMMAQRTSNEVTIDAVEIETNAYEQAVENTINCKWKNRINIYHSSIQEYTKNHSKKYDLIISNPPFFIAGTKSEDQHRNAARHTHTLSQIDLLTAANNLLTTKGKFNVVLPIKEGEEFILKAETFGLHCNRITSVKPKIDKPIERALLEFSLKKIECERNVLEIQHDARNHYTNEYIALTKEFYTIM